MKGIYGPIKKAVDITAFISPGQQVIQFPKVDVTFGIPAEAFVAIKVLTNCTNLRVTK